MAEAVKLECQQRELKNKGFLNQIHSKAMVPGVVYGNGMIPVHIAAEAKQLDKVFQVHGRRALFSLAIPGEKVPLMVVVRDIQKHPFNGKLIHIDFLQVNMTEKITSKVGINISGEDELLNKNVVLVMGLKEIEISCLPGNLPETIVCDIAHLQAGDKITVADLSVPAEVDVITDSDTLVVSIMAPVKPAEGEEAAGGK